MAIDPFLYVSFGAGLLAGRLTTWRGPWLKRATDASIVVLLFTLGIVIGPTVSPSTVAVVLLAVATAGALISLTALFSWLIPHRSAPPSEGETAQLATPHLHGAWFLAAVVAGGALGHFVSLTVGPVLSWELYALMFLVSFDLVLRTRALKEVWVPIAAAFGAAFVIAALIVVLGRLPWPVALAIPLGMGFYTLTGPLVTASAGARVGLFAFLANFLRENLTMLSAPWIGPKVKGEGLSAMGGATSMDTTLYFIVNYGDRTAGSLGVATGLILTVMASLVLPALLAVA